MPTTMPTSPPPVLDYESPQARRGRHLLATFAFWQWSFAASLIIVFLVGLGLSWVTHWHNDSATAIPFIAVLGGGFLAARSFGAVPTAASRLAAVMYALSALAAYVLLILPVFAGDVLNLSLDPEYELRRYGFFHFRTSQTTRIWTVLTLLAIAGCIVSETLRILINRRSRKSRS